MTSTKKDPVLVVLQLSGGNDARSTRWCPTATPCTMWTTGRRYACPEEQVLKLSDKVGFNPNMGPNEAAL